MAKLAIKGCEFRGNEVIAILEMLGGKNTNPYSGDSEGFYYYIDNDDNIECDADEEIPFPCIDFTLDEFLEKYPYKVGEKVYYDNKTCDVIEMLWNSNLNTISYGVYDGKIKNLAIAEELKSYKEETMETITIDDFKANTKEWLIDKLESMSKDNALQAICNIHDELHKPKYPKTFIEVLNFWHSDRQLEDDYQRCYKKDLIEKFQDLLYARDAYWKIAGEQMGLGQPWKPDWENGLNKCCLTVCENRIIKSSLASANAILAFPTEEMRDAFYENFKELIEECKELL